jgi:endonuclease IV/DNA polymerase/3'-5' exonuclease PolX
MNYIGVHIDDNNYDTVLNALKIAHSLGAHVLQIYAGDKILTTLRKKYVFTPEEATYIKKFLKDTGMRLYIHAILRINFCNDPEYDRYRWMTDNIIHDMKQCKRIGGHGVVVHCGSYKTKTVNLTRYICIEHFKTAIKLLLKAVPRINLIIETPVNREYGVGGTIHDLNELYESFKNKIKFCIDTQHIFASGFDLKEYFTEFDNVIGLKNVALIHLNDSMKDFNSHVNRHSPIGKGYLFPKSNSSKTDLLKYVLELANKNKIDMVMETDFSGYKKDINYLKKLTEVKKIKGGSKKNIKPLILKIFNALLFNYQNKLASGTSNITVRYKIDSYQKAIHSIEKYEKPIYSSDDVKDLEYIGKGMSEKIDEIAQTGTLQVYNDLKKNKSIDAYHTFITIWGFGDAMIRHILAKKIYTIAQLKSSIKRNEIKLTEGQEIGLKYYKELSQKIPRMKITEITKILKECFVRKTDINVSLYNAGSYRAGAKMCGDIDFILTCKSRNDLKRAPSIFRDILIAKKMLKETLSSGEKKSIYIVKSPLKSSQLKSNYYKIDIAYILEEQLPWYLLYFGSSREFSKKIRTIASKKGYKLNEKGLFNKKTGKMLDFQPRDEKEIFDFLEIEYVDVKDRY